jgi:hypothetical protein
MSLLLTAAIMVAIFIASQLLMPKPDVEDARPAGEGDFKFPTADEDRPVPIMWGTCMLAGPNVAWSGDFKQKAITDSYRGRFFQKEEFIKGWKYYFGMQMLLCRGEIDAVTQIQVGEKILWSGSQAAGTIAIDEPDFWGGADMGGGGIVGNLEIQVGTLTQTPSTYLADFQTITGAATPASPRYGGTAQAICEQVYLGTSTSIKPWKFKVQRFVNGLGLSVGQTKVNGADANPIAVAYEILSDTEWGLGQPDSLIDKAGMYTAAVTCANEGLGFSMQIESEIDAEKVLEEIERTIDGFIRVNRTTGKWEVKLARADYDIDTVPQATDANVLEVQDFTRSTWEDTVNEVRVIYTDRDDEFQSKPALARDKANITIQSRVAPIRSSYPSIKYAAQANNTAWRDLRAVSYPRARVRLTVDRTFFGLNRGDVVAWTCTEHSITKMALRVMRVDYGSLTDGKIVLECNEDVYRFAAASGGDPDPTKWVPPSDSLGAFPTDEQIAFEAPRKLLTLSGDGISPKIWCGGRQQDVAAGFDIKERHSSGTPTGVFTLAGEAWGFILIGELLSSLAAGSAIPLSTLILDPDPDTQSELVAAFSEGIVAATAEILGTELRNLILVGDEFMLVKTAETNGANVQLNNVYRGVMDTVQADHAAATPVYLVFNGGNLTTTVFPEGNNVHLKFLPKSRTDTLSEVGATQILVALDKRRRRPYPPGRILLNTAAYPASVSLEGAGANADNYGVLIDWTRRDYRTNDEVDALTTDAATTFPDFPTANTTTYDSEVRADPAGSDDQVQDETDVQPTRTALRNDILIAKSGVIPSELRFKVLARHDDESESLEAQQELVYDAAVTTALTGDFNFGALASAAVSNLYTATVAGTYAFVLVSAMPGGSAKVEYRLNGGSWTTLIAAASATGSILGVAISDTIEIRHDDSTTPFRRFIAMTAAGAGQDGYAVLYG